MKAVSMPAPGRVEIIDIPEPTVGPEEVLVEVSYLGLCGSDLGMYRGTFTAGTYPRVPGHEVSGTIIATGIDVPVTIGVGDRVTLSPYTECGACPACRAGRTNCCQFNQTMGLQRDGAMVERLAIHHSKAYASNALNLKELVLVEPMSVGYHAANRGEVTEDDTVLVIGCGTIGLGALAASARKGATVIVADVDDGKLELAARFGARFTINATRHDPLAEVSRLTNGEGVQVAIEAVGLPQTYRQAIDAACYAGRVVYVGYTKSEVCYDATAFVRKELDIRGSRNALGSFPDVIQMLESRRQPFEELITRVYPVTRTEQAFAEWNADWAAIAKILIDMEH